MTQSSQPLLPAPPAFTDTQLSAPIPPPIITTSRLLVRPYHPQDTPSMILSANNPAIIKYMTNAFPFPYDLAVAHTWIAMNLDQPHPAHFGIFALSAPDIVIGGIGLNKLSTDVHAHTAEVGFWIAESCWGKGLMTEALRGFTTWAFEKFEGKDGQRIRKLWAGVYEGNGGSMKCFLKCGYAEEGVMKGYVEKNGVVLDMHIFGMVKGDWESNE